MVIPQMSKFHTYQPGNVEQSKQDYKQKAFHRLTARIQNAFPRLSIMLLLNRLYPKGLIMQCCQYYSLDFMNVLKGGSLPTVWEEYESLLPFEKDNQLQRNWGDRKQNFQWVNPIQYAYGANGKELIDIHVVACHEQWQEIDDKAGQPASKTMHQAWISSRPSNQFNVHARCNLGACYRWGIEAGFLVEKDQGYAYEHLIAINWNPCIIHGLHHSAPLPRAVHSDFKRWEVLLGFWW